MLETRRRLVDRPCRNHATTDSEPKPARNQTRRELLLHDADTRYAYTDRQRTSVRTKKNGEPRANSAWTLNASIWKELENARADNVSVNRLVSVHDFESENGYEVNPDEGKPLSAYKFALSNVANADLPIQKVLREIVTEEYSKDWSQADIEEVIEPHNA